MTRELSLSSIVTIAWLFLSLVCIDFIVWNSGCLLCLRFGLL